jgi:Sap, sulfolipid-1-addressing protein
MVLLMGVGMAIDPVRLGLAVVMLSRRRPMLNLFAFWVGGMVAGVGLGLAVLVLMRDVAMVAMHYAASTVNDVRSAVAILAGGRLQIAIGMLILLFAARQVIRSRARVGQAAVPVGAGGMSPVMLEERPTSPFARLGARTQEMLDCDVVWPAFVVGVASSAPPIETVVAFTVIMASGAAIGTQFSAFVVFTLMVLAVIEIPLVGYLAMPQRTEELMLRFQNWVRTYRQQISRTIFVGVGIIFLIQGMAAL